MDSETRERDLTIFRLYFQEGLNSRQIAALSAVDLSEAAVEQVVRDLLGAARQIATRDTEILQRFGALDPDISHAGTSVDREHSPRRLPASDPEIELVKRAADVVGPSRVGAWMREPLAALKGRTPFSLMSSEEGREEVERVLGRIEHGVF